jgi:DinB superfamily
MKEEDLYSLRHPIGKQKIEGDITDEMLKQFIKEIEDAPAELRKAISGLNEEQLNTPYRPGGWTVKQVVHHLPDSHLNCYIRFKLALTENEPLVKPYKEAAWAALKDSILTPADVSLNLFDALQTRWTVLLRSMSKEDFARKYNHPENGLVRLDRVTAVYAWHGRHHIAHITSLRKRMNW